MSTTFGKEDAEHAIRILLLVNRNDKDYERLKEGVHKLVKTDGMDEGEIEQGQRDFIEISQDILKREWGVVKSEINHFEDDARSIKDGEGFWPQLKARGRKLKSLEPASPPAP